MTPKELIKTDDKSNMSSKTAPALETTCRECEEPGNFMTPEGVLCSDHAVAATLSQERTKHDNPWFPIRLNRVSIG